MTDVSGIPNMGFGGGGYFGGSAALGQPAMSSAQIMASLYGNYSPAAAQAYNPFANSGGYFGAQPAYYAALGAAYGRQTGGFGGAPEWQINQARKAGGGGYNAPRQYGWDANEGATVPNPYNAPMSYGWDANEGAPAPAYTPPHSMGQFNPQTYGWVHNEGAAGLPEWQRNQMNKGLGLYGANSGSLGSMGAFGGYQPYQAPLQQPFGGMWQNRISPQIPSFPSSVTVPGQQSSGYGPGIYAQSPFGT